MHFNCKAAVAMGWDKQGGPDKLVLWFMTLEEVKLHYGWGQWHLKSP